MVLLCFQQFRGKLSSLRWDLEQRDVGKATSGRVLSDGMQMFMQVANSRAVSFAHKSGMQLFCVCASLRIYVCICVSVCICICVCPQSPEKGIDPLGARVRGSCEPFNMGDGS